MNRQEQRRLRLFERGLEAIQQHVGVPADLYFCPLCCRGFDRAQLAEKKLTLEHVPPESQGGRDIALTCVECNSTAGHEIDRDATQCDSLHQLVEALFHKGGLYEGRGRIKIQGQQVNINYTVQNRVLTVVPHEGNPPNASASLTLLPPGSGTNQKIHFNSGIRYNGWHARVSTLRAAYLAAFAKFGYGYIMHPRLAPVRYQIQHPEEKALPGFWIDPDYDGHKGPVMAIFWDPVPCLLVRINQRAALLPIPAGKRWSYPFPAPSTSKPHRLRLEGGRVLTWPRTLEMRRDFGVEAA